MALDIWAKQWKNRGFLYAVAYKHKNKHADFKHSAI